MNKIAKQLVETVKWEDDPDTFDQRLCALGSNEYDEFIVVNPKYDPWILNYVDTDIVSDDRCLIWNINQTWIVKKFKSTWNPTAGWALVDCEIDLKPEVEYNAALSFLEFDIDKTLEFDDAMYEYVYYLHPSLDPDAARPWVAKVRFPYVQIKGSKKRGYVKPIEGSLPELEFNPDIPQVEFDSTFAVPYYDLKYENIWYLDNKFNPFGKKIWLAKLKPKVSEGTKDRGYVAPSFIKNPDIPDVDFHFSDDIIPYYDLVYDLVWYLDPQFNPSDDKIWAVKIKSKYNEENVKDVGYVSPKVTFNPDLPARLDYYVDSTVPYYDLGYEHVWYLPDDLHSDAERIWAAKIIPNAFSLGVKDMGNIGVKHNQFDVVFISYHEPNAEANWQILKERFPFAKRVKNVKGIFEAHKQAAQLATTEMFYVVDGDAEIVDDFNFDFVPPIFQMNCVHLWTSLNPINDLEYGYGGVKLFPRQVLLDAETWNIDLTTGLGPLAFYHKVSNVTAFNTDPFNTWRSAFRECAKLSASLHMNQYQFAETEERLRIWNSVGEDKPFGTYALHGAKLGTNYGLQHFNDVEMMKKINDFEWMKNEFTKFFQL